MMCRMPPKLVQKLGHTGLLPKLSPYLVPLDKLVAKLTKGRVVALGLVPSLTITTIGKKSGQTRTQPLLYVADGEDILLLGSNWGKPPHPSWSANLLANPQATVKVKGRERSVTARLLKGEEREQAWQLALKVWPAYDTYAKRAAHRQIRVFRLS